MTRTAAVVLVHQLLHMESLTTGSSRTEVAVMQDMLREGTTAGEEECERALWGTIQRLTQEQLGQSILKLLSTSITQVRTNTSASTLSVDYQVCIPPTPASRQLLLSGWMSLPGDNLGLSTRCQSLTA